MSTTDTRAAFEAWHKEKFGYVDLGYCASDDAEKRWEGYQAATEAAKATGTAGELPPLPEEIEVGGEGWGWEDFQSEKTFSVEHMLYYGAACAQAAFAEAARQPEAVKATGTACTTCNGTGLVDDGEIDHYPNGEPYMCGPVKCVKDCPDCTPAARQPAPVAEGCALCGSAIGHDLDCQNHPTNVEAPFQQDDEHKAFMATYLDAARKASDNTSAGMILWHANRHWNGKAGEMWRARAALAATAAPVRNEADERDNEIFELQKALAFWLPQVNQFMSDEMSQRIAHDAYMLVIDGNLPDDFKTAQELGWILPATGKVQRDAEMVCGNCMEPIPTTVMDTSSTRAPADALSDESIDELAKPLMEQCVIVYGDMRRFARAIIAATRSQP